MRLVISFSGGETSAYMLWLILSCYAAGYTEIIVVFANTGQEHEATLEFVRDVAAHFGVTVVWLEAVTFPEEGRSSGHRIVSFETASRNGEPFEQMISKYGIPNKAYPHCTRELKRNAINSYVASLGWEKGTYQMAVGIRADEAGRLSGTAEKDGLVYPLCHWRLTDKIDVNNFWESQPFRLHLRSHQGNCSWCWKKSEKKLMRLIHETPHIFEFPRRMEATHGLSGHNVDGTPRVFFRQNMSTDALFEAYRHLQQDGWQDDMFELGDEDQAAGCTESCEAWGEAA